VALSNASWASLGGLSDHTAHAAGGNVYVLGGQGGGRNDTYALLSAALWQFDTTYQQYTQLASLPYPMTRHSSALVTNATGSAQLLVLAGGIGGDSGLGMCWPPSTCTASQTNIANGADASGANPGRTGGVAFKYSFASNTWTSLPNLGVPRSDACAVAIGTKVYVVGGYGESYNISDAVESLDTSVVGATWQRLAPLPLPLGDHNCVAYGGNIYVFGGFYDPDCALPTVGCFSGTQQNSALYNGVSKFSFKTYIYTPATNTWSQGANMRYRRGDSAAAVMADGRVVVAGGEHSDRLLDAKVPQHSVEIYSPTDNTWAEKAPMPYARFRFALAAVGTGAVYAFGGQQLCFGSQGTCSVTAGNTASVLYELDHPNVFVQLRNGVRGNTGGLVLPGATSSEDA
jgi:hypothetical protein